MNFPVYLFRQLSPKVKLWIYDNIKKCKKKIQEKNRLFFLKHRLYAFIQTCSIALKFRFEVLVGVPVNEQPYIFFRCKVYSTVVIGKNIPPFKWQGFWRFECSRKWNDFETGSLKGEHRPFHMMTGGNKNRFAKTELVTNRFGKFRIFKGIPCPIFEDNQILRNP